mmetsp:Transcript_42134/g.133770  ORF Transcript_42134/g.133770 Transcript_42134/m.133770 type:complete len:245 (+) Transcript_42134:855-1589(+)
MGRSSCRASAIEVFATSSASAALSANAAISSADSFALLEKGSTCFSASLMAASTAVTISGLAAAALAFSRSWGFISLMSSTLRLWLTSLRYRFTKFTARASRLSNWPSRISGRFASAANQAFNSALMVSSTSLSGVLTWPRALDTASCAALMASSTSAARASISSTDLFVSFTNGSTCFSAFSTACSAAVTGAAASLILSFSSSFACSSLSFFAAATTFATAAFAWAIADLAAVWVTVPFGTDC